MYLLTCEQDYNGIWLDDAEGFDSLANARSRAVEMGKPAIGHSRVIYYCREVEIIAYDE